jgi:hypothetical protein
VASQDACDAIAMRAHPDVVCVFRGQRAQASAGRRGWGAVAVMWCKEHGMREAEVSCCPGRTSKQEGGRAAFLLRVAASVISDR